MKTVVFAYHDMGITGLQALKRAGFTMAAVFSHEDDPQENCWFGSVRDWAKAEQIPLYCPQDVNQPVWFEKIAALAPEIIFSFYYRNLLAPEILAIPPAGAFNLHGSLLPAYRGRCPVNWVLVKGEEETGVTLHRMVGRADAGEIVAQMSVPVAFEDTARSLYGKLCGQAARMLAEVLPALKEGRALLRPQDLQAGSYFGGRTPEDGRIDWQWPALQIYNLIRAVTEPYPGAFTVLAKGEKMIVWWALPEAGGRSRPAGTLEREGEAAFMIAGDGGRLRLLDIEIQGKRLRNGEIGQYFQERIEDET